MPDSRKVGAVTYREAGQDYFDKRGLRRHAGVWSLWALGVAAVISGDFFGWNFGLAYGFGGLLVATVVITVMYSGSASRSRRCRPRFRTPAAPTRSRARPWGRGAASPPAWPKRSSTS